MKNILTIFSLLFLTNLALAQPPKYDDLKILYADANYEKLTKVAEKYVTNDKTKKHSLPYIWLSKALYKISLSGTTDEKYKNAYKEAIKFLGKGVKNDLKYNEGATLEEHSEFMDEFQLSLQEMIENEAGSGNFKKAYGWAIKYQKITTHLVGVKYMMGACKHFDQDKGTARLLWQEARALLEEVEGIDAWSEADRNILKSGMLYSAQALMNSRQNDKAKALLNKAAQWFEEDEDWQERYDDVVN